MNRIPIRSVLVLAIASFAAASMAWEALARRGSAVPSPPAADSFAVFARVVVPVLDRRCGGCHGVQEAEYASLREEAANRVLLRWPVDASGRIGGGARSEEAFARCTTAVSAAGNEFAPLDRSGPPLASALLRAPLAESLGGSVHPEVFASLEDADFLDLASWVALETRARPGPPVRLQPGAETFFAEKVVPILERKTCFGSNCHGRLAFNDLKLDPGIPALPGRFTPALHRANRHAMLGQVTRLVHLSGDVEQSKQLKKSVPPEQGGIIHKGGNNFLDRSDPDYAVLKAWLELERAEAAAAVGDRPGDVHGIVFVRRPRATPERALEPLVWLPGGDLFLARGETEVNLTAPLHPGSPADVRAADVSYDGRRVAVAIRFSEDGPFNVWEIELASGAARALTFSTDPAVHFIDPLYVPDPQDPAGRDLGRADLVVLSTLSGEVCDVSPDGILGEAEGGGTEVILDEEVTERAGTWDGREVRIVRGKNAGQRRVIARQEPGRIRVDRPFPDPCDSTTHYVVESPVRVAPKFDLYRLRQADAGAERDSFSRLQRMTWSPSQARRPFLRSSGEVMATFLRTGWQDGRPFFNGAIFRTHIDGSNFHTHAANRSGVPIHIDGRELPDGLEVRVGRDADSWWGGMPILADHQFGPHIEDRNPLDDLDHPAASGPPMTALTRFVPGWIPLDRTASTRGLSPGGAWHDLCPLPDGSILASVARGPLDLNDPAAAPDFDIIRLVPDPAFQSPDGFQPGTFRREPVAGGPESELWPRPVVARLKEPVSKVLKKEEALFGPARLVGGVSRYPGETPAVVQVFDLLLLDAFFTQSTPSGVRHIAEDLCPSCAEPVASADRVRFARIVALEPRRTADPPRRLLVAEVPVEADGSVHVVVPSGLAFDIESLNTERMALRSPNRWLYTLPGEKHTLSIPRALYAQTCGGCHGGLTGRAADVFRRPDVVTSASRTQAIWDPSRLQRVQPANWDGGHPPVPTAVTFERDVRPVLARACTGCHEGRGAAGGLDLSGPRAHEALRAFLSADDLRAVAAPLLEILDGREFHAEGGAPLIPHAPLSPEDRLTLIRWIDLGAGR